MKKCDLVTPLCPLLELSPCFPIFSLFPLFWSCIIKFLVNFDYHGEIVELDSCQSATGGRSCISFYQRREVGAMAEDWERARDWLKQESVTKMSAKVK